MKKLLCILLLSALFLSGTAAAGAAEPVREEKGRAYYDFGVFAFEEGDYASAENHLKIALEFDPDNPYYHHFIGKICLQTERYAEARKYLDRAGEIRNDIAGLDYDRAWLDLKTENYAQASGVFARLSEKEADNVLAIYYAGICYYRLEEYETAGGYFISAAEKSPSLRANAYYHAGICFRKSGDIRQALEMFEYVKNDPDAGILRDSAVQWIEMLKQQEVQRPYKLFLKVGAVYDDNVQLMPDDTGIFEDRNIVTDASDGGALLRFSGNYDIFSRNNYTVGLGFSQYNTRYSDLDEYNLTGSSGHLYGSYSLTPLDFRFHYFPSYYWADSDSYLRQHRLEPEIIWHVGRHLQTRFSYRYKDNTYFEDSRRSGHGNELFGDIVWSLLRNKVQVFGGMGYEDYSASHKDQYYSRWSARAGGNVEMPWDISLGLSGEYQSRDYDNADSTYNYNMTREDDKYIFAVHLSRKLWTDWIAVMAEYRHTRNDSNIPIYEYSRNISSISLTLSY
ncbi:MAG: surface lipoprotein assembly modifier [Desulfococcaceae bacterium]|jgi:tetratricopeptide (TPR) repeat protein|nr:surface lipoprotein assembly modifier [Desulfococcaceae bacterium]